MNLDKPVGELGRVFKMQARKLEKLGIKTAWDFLLHVPSRYEDYSLVSKISQLQPGETVTVNGEVLEIKNQYTRRWKNLQKAKVTDGTGKINILWFNQPYLAKNIKTGDKIALSGKVSSDKDELTMISPDYELLTASEPIHTGRLVPVYPETRGLSSKWLRRQIKKLLDEEAQNLDEYLPPLILKERNLMDLKNALLSVHFPKNLEEADRGRGRLAFDELFLIQLKSKIKKEEWKKDLKGIPFEVKEPTVLKFYKNLPFELTNAQKKAAGEILVDLSAKKPMNRLLQGDVGSGKTVLAALAMYIAKLSGYKSVLMAPTEILAQQHYRTLSELLEPLGIKVELVTSSTKNHKSSIINHKSGEKPNIFVGTHALLHRKDELEGTGLVVIDEQQRFGVAQRSLIRQKGDNPHFLTMTATPIPRTVALAIYGDLDVSYLHDMPVGRKKIKTWLVPPTKRENAYKWIEKEIKEHGTQAFIICPFIEESESMQTVKAAKAEYERLKTQVFKDLKLNILHGKLKSTDKEKVMADFKNKKFDILVATPLVEVGIDIPNASIILIEAADRFGLAQLHQLRGRVGRGDQQSYCLLFTESKSSKAYERLKAMEKLQSGAELAELDLKLRGPGDMYGTAQHGIPRLKVASFSDISLIEKANTAASRILPNLSKHPELVEKIKEVKISEVSPD